MQEYKPLTKEQYDSATKAGFSHDQIVQNEIKRKNDMTSKTTATPPQSSAIPPGSIGMGFLKGAGDVINTINKNIADPIYSKLGLETPSQSGEAIGITEESLKAKNTGEKIGKFVEGVAEFAIPATKIVRGGKVAKATADTAIGAADVKLHGGSNLEAAVGGVAGGVIGTAARTIQGMGGVKGTLKTLFPQSSLDENVGKVLQGSTDAIQAGKRVFQKLETEGVKTYSDLKNKITSQIAPIARKVDKALSADKTPVRIEDLILNKTTKGGATVRVDYVTPALESLKELYTKIGDRVAATEIDELVKKATTEGLTRLEVNNLARNFGSEFGSKAFSKGVEQTPLTSVNAQMFENIRSGLKEVARNTIKGKLAKKLDAELSDLYDVERLVSKMVERVSKEKQKTLDQGVLARGGELVGSAIDKLTAGSISGAARTLLKTGQNKGTASMIEIEQELGKLLGKIKGTNLKKGLQKGTKDSLEMKYPEASKVKEGIDKEREKLFNKANELERQGKLEEAKKLDAERRILTEVANLDTTRKQTYYDLIKKGIKSEDALKVLLDDKKQWEKVKSPFANQNLPDLAPALEYDELPSRIKKIVNTFDESRDAYKEADRLIRELERNGYTAEYGLDGVLHSFRKITSGKG